MGRVGWWTYWYKAPDFDILFTKNKKQLPKGQPYIRSFAIDTPNGRDYELSNENGKVLFYKKNIHKLSQCEDMQFSYEIQKMIHKFLNVSYPKEYKTIFNRKIRENNIKGCKIK